jgi:hypothetical protein
VNVYIERNPSKGIAITTAGTDGKFEFNINRNLIGKKVTISAQSFGYVDCPLKFIVTNSPITPVTVLMKPTSKHVNDLTDTMVLGMVSPTIKSINTDTIIKKVK